VKYLDAWSYASGSTCWVFLPWWVPMERSPEGRDRCADRRAAMEEERVLAVASVLEEARGEWPQSPMASA